MKRLGPVWRMQAVYWLLSGERRLYVGSCLEHAGCLVALVWRMQAVSGFFLGSLGGGELLLWEEKM